METGKNLNLWGLEQRSRVAVFSELRSDHIVL